MPKLISITSPSGGQLIVATRTPQGYLEPVGAKEVIEKIDGSLDHLYSFAISAAQQFADAAKVAGAKSSEIELGLGFTAKGSVYVCETTAEATIKLKFVF